jgi:protein TonB
MKTFVFSAALAVVFHALLFSLGAGSPPKKLFYQTNKPSLSISIDYVKPSIHDAPLPGKPPEPVKRPEALRKRHEKKLPRAKPKVQKAAVTKKAETPSPPKVKVEENASLPGPPSPNPAPAMIDTDSRPQVEHAAAPMRQSDEGSLTTASLPHAEVREAIPVYRSNPPPEYPAVARRRGYEGTVVVEVLVSKEGGVQDFRLLQSSGYPVLDRAATAAIKSWLFEPARKGDKKIEMWVKVPVRFQLK